MTVLWWFVGTVLIVLSFVLWVAGLAGREGILRIGKVTAAERREESEAQLRPVKTSNIVVGIVGIMVGLAMILIFAL
jgi:uncharacterized membrane protein